MKKISEIVFCLALLLVKSSGFDLKDITKPVFGDKVDFLPAAFGDFNSDKLTDLIVFDNHKKSVAVLLATEQSVVNIGSDTIFRSQKKSLNCTCPQDGLFVSTAPGDFNGDGNMDLMTVAKHNNDDDKVIHIFWGARDSHGAKLECDKDLVTISEVDSEPLVFDFNDDSIADLLTVDKDGNRTVYVFDKNKHYKTEYLETDQKTKLKAEHGNAYVDITSDGRADLVLTTVTGLELHEGTKTGFRYKCTVPWPQLDNCDADQCVGQPVFLDFSLSGSLSLVLAVCGDPVCDQSLMYLVPVSDLVTCHTAWSWEPMSLELGNYRFMPRNPTKSPLSLISPRVGDVDLDGYPDLLMTMYNKSGDHNVGEVQLLLNVPCGPMTGCKPLWRQFQIQPGYTQAVKLRSSHQGQPVAAAFFDLYEDGKMDMIVINKDDHDKYNVAAYANTTQDSDAYFMKVIVLTGSCYHNCPGHDQTYVPYGTNTGGQLIGYQSQRPGQEKFDTYQSVAVQLPQTGHFSLGLPYTIFGLGMAPNFVDELTVNISSLSHDWPQIIPNSQLYVIPYPLNNSNSWDVKLIITTSKNIVITGLALVGTCALCSVIIVMLHIRQKRQDRQAKLQDAGRFHFDAM